MKEGIGARGWGSFVDREAAIVNGAGKVGWHCDAESAVIVESNVHAEERMVLSTGYSELSEILFQEVNDVGDDGGFFVRDFGVIDIPGNGTLGAVNGGVRDAEVVRINCKTVFFESARE